MLREITSAELTELEAMWAIEGGWGDWKQDYRVGQLTSVIAETSRDRKKRLRPFSAEDFALRPREPKRIKPKNRTKKMRAAFDMMAQPKKGKK